MLMPLTARMRACCLLSGLSLPRAAGRRGPPQERLTMWALRGLRGSSLSQGTPRSPACSMRVRGERALRLACLWMCRRLGCVPAGCETAARSSAGAIGRAILQVKGASPRCRWAKGEFLQVAAIGDLDFCGLRTDHSITCTFDYALVEDPAGEWAQAAEGACGIRPTGEIECWGPANLNEPPDSVGPVTAAAAGRPLGISCGCLR